MKMEKKLNLLYLLLGCFFLITSCEPKEERHDLGSVYTEQELLNYMDIIVNGNNVTLKNNAPEVISYWKTSFGSQFNKNTAQDYIPVKGKYTATVTAFCAGGTVTASKEFTIEESDPEYFSNPFWNLLTNGEAGKTWVWASDIPGGKVWGNGGYIGSTSPAWWTLGIGDIPAQGGDASDEITFTLLDGIKFSVSSTLPTAVPGSGSGTFNMDLSETGITKYDNGTNWSYGKITFTNHTIPLGFEPNTSGKPLHYTFDILKLTKDELVLAFGEPGAAAWGGAWFYMFKRKGFSY